ncbi:hypothetical protein HG531_010191 [Fusarium graminearum]|nr:hypothetical protein HG531_010191 [Fusarium graminearum]
MSFSFLGEAKMFEGNDISNTIVTSCDDPLSCLTLDKAQDTAALTITTVTLPLLLQTGLGSCGSGIGLDNGVILVSARDVSSDGEAAGGVVDNDGTVDRASCKEGGWWCGGSCDESKRLDALGFFTSSTSTSLRLGSTGGESWKRYNLDGSSSTSNGDKSTLGVNGKRVKTTLNLETLIISGQSYSSHAVIANKILGCGLTPDIPDVQATILRNGGQKKTIRCPSTSSTAASVEEVGLNDLEGVGLVLLGFVAEGQGTSQFTSGTSCASPRKSILSASAEKVAFQARSLPSRPPLTSTSPRGRVQRVDLGALEGVCGGIARVTSRKRRSRLNGGGVEDPSCTGGVILLTG